MTAFSKITKMYHNHELKYSIATSEKTQYFEKRCLSLENRENKLIFGIYRRIYEKYIGSL